MKDKIMNELEELVCELKCVESCDNYNEIERHFKGNENLRDLFFNCELEGFSFKETQTFIVKKYEELILDLLKKNM